MRIARTLEELKAHLAAARERRERIAFIPTMGALHQGHLSLLRLGHQLADYCVVSIFVNPRQFNSPDDLARYPRSIEKDSELLQSEGADLLFLPSESEIYPPDSSAVPTITAGDLGRELEGASRPGHFDGVLTVVSRLFDLVQPDVAIFGEKDAQQLFLIQQLVSRQNREHLRARDTQVVAAPTVREDSGLALSSRNQRLDRSQLDVAAGIYRALKSAAGELEKRVSFPAAIRLARELLPKSVAVDYVELVSAADFAPITADFFGEAILLFAGEVAGVRLIDNVRVTLPQPRLETGQTRATDQESEGSQ